MILKAIIIEDELKSREILKNMLEEYCDSVKVIASASNVTDAIDLLNSTQTDVVFMDIELQSGTGFDILSQLPEINFKVIFTTAFDQYAIKAVKFSSLDYLLKPIDLEELQDAVEKVKIIKNEEDYNKQLQLLIKNIQHPKHSRICLSTSDGFEFINIIEILYCEAEGSYTCFKLVNGEKILVSKHLKEYENMLADQNFMRVHKSYLINLKEVKKFVKSDGGYIVMNNDDIISISRDKKELFIAAMQILT